MRNMTRRAGIAAAGTVLGVLGFAGPALAGGGHPEPPHPPGDSRCNAGNGNESEAESDRCIGGDPGNSFNAGNRGGDEVGDPDEGGVEGSEPNPGGNNTPGD